MSTDERIQKIIDSWQSTQRLKEDTWQNVQLVLTHYGFTYERKKEWVCRHDEFTQLAKNPRAKEIIKSVGLGPLGEFAIAVSHGTNRKAGMVIQRYLKNILKAIELLEIIKKGKEKS